MQTPTSTHEFETETRPAKLPKPMVLHHHHPSKPHKTYRRSGHFRPTKYADIGFTIIKVNKKYIAHCKLCNRTLGNTAYSRLTGHRNICREAIPENEVDSPLNPASANGNYATSLPHNFFAQTTNNDSSKPSFNVITPKQETLDCQLNESMFPINESRLLEHHSSYSDPEQDREMLNEENQLKLNMIEVLLPIKQNKKLLFEDNTSMSMELWMKILTKAQYLNLAPPGVHWTYARDSLYSVWRLHTLQKRDAVESGDTSVKYNIVDLSILQIENCISENDHLFGMKTSNSVPTQTVDEMYTAELRLKQLQCEAIEIENYKRCLEALELERRLEVPHAKITLKYIPSVQFQSSTRSRLNGELLENSRRVVKIELDD